MAFTGAGLNRFRQRVDEVLREAFPCELLIDGRAIAGAGPGGRVVSEYINGGESMDYRFPFRFPAAGLAKPLVVGSSVDWKLADGRVLKLEVAEIPERPHEDSVSITCKKRREG